MISGSKSPKTTRLVLSPKVILRPAEAGGEHQFGDG